VFKLAAHTALLPVMLPGVGGMTLTVTAFVCAADEPQALLAVTVMFPPVIPAVVIIDVVVEVPVHPPGNVHV
jgi:hypothetical protein